MKPIIEILIGQIGSGKTTECKKRVKEGYYVVSRDDFRYMIGAGDYIFDKETEPIIKKVSKNMIAHLVSAKKNIIVDETNMSVEQRKETIEIAKLNNYEIIAVQTKKISKEESVKRRLGDNHGTQTKETWEMVWEFLNNLYEPPTIEEGFDKIIQLEG